MYTKGGRERPQRSFGCPAVHSGGGDVDDQRQPSTGAGGLTSGRQFLDAADRGPGRSGADFDGQAHPRIVSRSSHHGGGSVCRGR